MGSEFDDAMSEMFDQAREIFGEEKFAISGKHFPAARTVSGNLNEVGTVSDVTLSGETIKINATLQIALTEFARLTPRAGQLVVRCKNGARFRIVGEVHKDSLAVTFALQTEHQ
jgi:hypothetical protein